MSVTLSESGEPESSFRGETLSIALPPALEWKDCDTVDKQIGFIIGQGFPFCLTKIGEGISFTIKVCHLDDAARACIRIFADAMYGICSSIQSLVTSLWDSVKPLLTAIYKRMPSISCRSEVIVGRFPSSHSCKRVSELCNRFFSAIRIGITALYNTVSPYFPETHVILDAIARLCQPVIQMITAVFQTISDAIAQISNHLKTRLDTLSQRLAPYFNEVRDFLVVCAEKCIAFANLFFDYVLVPLNQHLFSPLYTYVLSPIGTVVSNFTYALLSGCCRTRASEVTGNVPFIDCSKSNELIRTVNRGEFEAHLDDFGLRDAFESQTPKAYATLESTIVRYRDLTSTNLQYQGSTFTILETRTGEVTRWTITQHLKAE